MILTYIIFMIYLHFMTKTYGQLQGCLVPNITSTTTTTVTTTQTTTPEKVTTPFFIPTTLPNTTGSTITPTVTTTNATATPITTPTTANTTTTTVTTTQTTTPEEVTTYEEVTTSFFISTILPNTTGSTITPTVTTTNATATPITTPTTANTTTTTVTRTQTTTSEEVTISEEVSTPFFIDVETLKSAKTPYAINNRLRKSSAKTELGDSQQVSLKNFHNFFKFDADSFPCPGDIIFFIDQSTQMSNRTYMAMINFLTTQVFPRWNHFRNLTIYGYLQSPNMTYGSNFVYLSNVTDFINTLFYEHNNNYMGVGSSLEFALSTAVNNSFYNMNNSYIIFTTANNTSDIENAEPYAKNLTTTQRKLSFILMEDADENSITTSLSPNVIFFNHSINGTSDNIHELLWDAYDCCNSATSPPPPTTSTQTPTKPATTITPPPVPQINCTNPQNELTSLYCNITNGTTNVNSGNVGQLANLTTASMNTTNTNDVYMASTILSNLTGVRNITKNDFNSVANLTDTIVDAPENTLKNSDVYKIGDVSTTQSILNSINKLITYAPPDACFKDGKNLGLCKQPMNCSSQETVHTGFVDDGERFSENVDSENNNFVASIQIIYTSECGENISAHYAIYRNMKLFQNSLSSNADSGDVDSEPLENSTDLQDRCYLGYLSQNQEVLSAGIIKDDDHGDFYSIKAASGQVNVLVKIIYRKDMITKPLHGQVKAVTWTNQGGWSKQIYGVEESDTEWTATFNGTGDHAVVTDGRETEPALCSTALVIIAYIINSLSLIAVVVINIALIWRRYTRYKKRKLEKENPNPESGTHTDSESGTHNQKSKETEEEEENEITLFVYNFLLITFYLLYSFFQDKAHSGTGFCYAIAGCIFIKMFQAFELLEPYVEGSCLEKPYKILIGWRVSLNLSFLAASIFIAIFAITMPNFFKRDDNFCWIRSDYTFPAVVLPMCFLLADFIIFLFLVIACFIQPDFEKLDKKQKEKKKNGVDGKKKFANVKKKMLAGGLGQVVVALPWMLQYLSLYSSGTTIWHALFVLLNGSRGIIQLALLTYVRYLTEKEKKSDPGKKSKTDESRGNRLPIRRRKSTEGIPSRQNTNAELHREDSLSRLTIGNSDIGPHLEIERLVGRQIDGLSASTFASTNSEYTPVGKIINIFVYVLLKEKDSNETQRTQFELNIPSNSTIVATGNQILKQLQLDADFVAIKKCEEFLPQFKAWSEIHTPNHHNTYIKDRAKYQFTLVSSRLLDVVLTPLNTTSTEISPSSTFSLVRPPYSIESEQEISVARTQNPPYPTEPETSQRNRQVSTPDLNRSISYPIDNRDNMGHGISSSRPYPVESGREEVWDMSSNAGLQRAPISQDLRLNPEDSSSISGSWTSSSGKDDEIPLEDIFAGLDLPHVGINSAGVIAHVEGDQLGSDGSPIREEIAHIPSIPTSIEQIPSEHGSIYDEVYEPIRDDPMISVELARSSNRPEQSPYDHIPSVYDDVYESLGDRPGNNQAMMEGIDDASLTLAEEPDESISQGCPTTRNQSSLSPIPMYDEAYNPGRYDQVPVEALENSERPIEIEESNHSHYYDDVTKAIESLQPTISDDLQQLEQLNDDTNQESPPESSSHEISDQKQNYENNHPFSSPSSSSEQLVTNQNNEETFPTIPISLNTFEGITSLIPILDIEMNEGEQGNAYGDLRDD